MTMDSITAKAINSANLKSTIAKLFTKHSRQKQNVADTESHILALSSMVEQIAAQDKVAAPSKTAKP